MNRKWRLMRMARYILKQQYLIRLLQRQLGKYPYHRRLHQYLCHQIRQLQVGWLAQQFRYSHFLQNLMQTHHQCRELKSRGQINKHRHRHRRLIRHYPQSREFPQGMVMQMIAHLRRRRRPNNKTDLE